MLKATPRLYVFTYNIQVKQENYIDSENQFCAKSKNTCIYQYIEIKVKIGDENDFVL